MLGAARALEREKAYRGCRSRNCPFVVGVEVQQTEEKENEMGKIVVTEFVSLDGVMEDPGGAEGYRHGGWTFEIDRGEEGDKFKLDELVEAEAQLLGRVTYDGFAAAWPTMEDGAGFAEKMNSMPKYVFSSTLQEASWENTTILSGDLAAGVAKLHREVDGVILVAGSAQLVQGLLEHDLVDELRLMVFPVLLGEGKRLFGDVSAKKPLRLTDSTTLGAGIALLTYEPAGS
jgi:dihydrofolate reductase